MGSAFYQVMFDDKASGMLWAVLGVNIIVLILSYIFGKKQPGEVDSSKVAA
jgi:glycerol uptake facilitator protein